MARVTAWLAAISFVAGLVTFVVGARVGYGSSTISSHLNWGALTLVLQLFTACVATIHSRFAAQELAELRALVEQAEARRGTPAGSGEEPRA
jgi:hypothetical protein